MAADIDIINSALSKLGEQNLLAITDQSPAGRLASRTYADLRDALLTEHAWNFASTRASLAANVAAPEWGYARSFTLPADCLRLVSVFNEFDAEWRNESGTIVTDMEAPLKILYIRRVPVDSMDATFKDALAARLAMEWAEPLAQTTTVSNSMAGLYRNKLQVARTTDGQTDQVRTADYPDFIDARY